jgi:hypothetical protein
MLVVTEGFGCGGKDKDNMDQRRTFSQATDIWKKLGSEVCTFACNLRAYLQNITAD